MFLKLMKSIVGTDSYFWIFVAFAVFFLVMSWLTARKIQRYVYEWEHRGNVQLTKYVHGELSVWYSLFTAMISIFPLLGMFGTVRGLLAMDLTGGDMTMMKGNFFGALTSTAWGIIFAIVFKLIHAAVQTYIETQIEDSQNMYDRLGQPERGRF